MIDAEKVRLRPLQAADVPDIKTWTTDISVYTYWGKGPGKTDRNPELLFERSPKPVKSFRLGIEEKRSGRLIGEVWVYRIEKKRMASVAIRLAAAWQGKGYGTEAAMSCAAYAFSEVEAEYLAVRVHKDNLPSRKVAEHLERQYPGKVQIFLL